MWRANPHNWGIHRQRSLEATISVILIAADSLWNWNELQAHYSTMRGLRVDCAVLFTFLASRKFVQTEAWGPLPCKRLIECWVLRVLRENLYGRAFPSILISHRKSEFWAHLNSKPYFFLLLGFLLSLLATMIVDFWPKCRIWAFG